jgi:hypothetical protein
MELLKKTHRATKRTPMNRLILCLSLVILTSCSGVYTNPPKDVATTSEIKNQNRRRGFFDWENFTIEMIDGRSVSYSLSWSYTTKTIRVTQGKHEIVISSHFNRGLGSAGPFSGRGAVTVNIKPGRVYRVNGRIDGVRVFYWIEDTQTGERACEEVSEPYAIMPQSYSYPIFIPVVR